jgi:LysR family hydrogen peroxide-inducible transcriptional activator
MVAAGIGCTLLPALAAVPGVGSVHSDLVEIRPLAAPIPYRTIGIVWRQHYPREAAVRGLAALIRDSLPAAVRPVPSDENGRRPGKPEPAKLARNPRRSTRAVAA